METKPAAGIRYLKWDNEIVGIIDKTGAVSFIAPELNEVVAKNC